MPRLTYIWWRPHGSQKISSARFKIGSDAGYGHINWQNHASRSPQSINASKYHMHQYTLCPAGPLIVPSTLSSKYIPTANNTYRLPAFKPCECIRIKYPQRSFYNINLAQSQEACARIDSGGVNYNRTNCAVVDRRLWHHYVHTKLHNLQMPCWICFIRTQKRTWHCWGLKKWENGYHSEGYTPSWSVPSSMFWNEILWTKVVPFYC